MPREAFYDSDDHYDDPNLVYAPYTPPAGKNSKMSGDSNRVSVDLSGAPITAINGAIGTLETQLAFQVSLTPDQKATMAKAGDKTAGFIEKCRQYVVSHPQFMPGFVDMAEWNKDVSAHDYYMQFLLRLRTLVANGNDTLLVINSEIYRVCLAYYEGVERAANLGVPGAQPIFDELKVRFPGRGPGSSNTPNKPTP